MKALAIAVQEQLLGRSIKLALLAEIDLASGTQRLWSGLGALSYGGFEWTGIGKLGRITGAGETTEIRVVETSYELSGVDDLAALNTFLEVPIRNRSARAWLAVIGDDGAVIADPIQIDETILDTASMRHGEDGTAVLVLRGTSAIFDFRKPRGRYLTSEQLKEDYPGDTGFDRISGLAARTVSWTRT